jgi:hypothetical protein
VPDPRHHPRERRIRALGNGIMFVAMLLGVAALVATILVIGSPVAALPGAVLAIGIIGVAAKYAPVPADPRYADELAADLAELPDRREAGLPYGAVLDGDDVVLVWVRWKRVLWLLLAAFLVLIAVVSVTGDIRNPGVGIALAALCLYKCRRYLRPGIVLGPATIRQPATGATVRWADVDRVSEVSGRGLVWILVRGRPGTVHRTLWGGLRRRIWVPVGALAIDSWDLVELLRYAVESAQGPVRDSDRLDVHFEVPEVL